jgi:branched-chain amino acid transport system ATP-binding protein
MLEINNLSTSYGRIQVLWDVNIEVKEGEIVALVGSNGAGKTTLVNTLSGLVKPTSGQITFMGNRIDGRPLHRIVELGISHVPEGGRVFRDMSVKENLEMGAYPMHAWKKREETVNLVYEVFPLLKERQKQMANTLSGGEQQMLAMGRGLMSMPKLCIFDEPSYGLAPILVANVFQVVKTLRDQGITIFLIEQNVKHTLEVSDRAYVLENGKIVIADTCCNLLQSAYIKKAYLGL